MNHKQITGLVKNQSDMAEEVRRHNETTLRELHRGDLVQIRRGYYSHWAVYKGNGRVIHLAGDENVDLSANLNPEHIFTISGERFKKAYVRESGFREAVGESKAYKNNEMDRILPPRDGEAIVRIAMDKIGEIDYNVLYTNCEHFANYCRYNKWKSNQVDKTMCLSSCIASFCLLFGGIGIAVFSGSR